MARKRDVIKEVFNCNGLRHPTCLANAAAAFGPANVPRHVFDDALFDRCSWDFYGDPLD